MKTKNTILLAALLLTTAINFAQAPLKEYKAGHIFYISLPEYMSKTAGLNSASTIEYKNVAKDVYGFVIEDNKEILALAELKFSSINEFYEDFIKDFLDGEKDKKAGTPKFQKKGEISFAEADVTYYDDEVKGEIYYLVGIVETKASYYKVLSWCVAENKAKFKADFQKILYSLRD